ncbi:lactate/malate dehydrogenase, NAD binding domain family protein [Aspergillus niger]|uniref:Lactate/malate dehydrogenase, NAD binding domain family protein n=1 Tax=Aspergillus niger TaxID=5061 RepID=A0A505I7U2_ASPNG|nr:lactate/malate dehydrogenase, NAD binding domain family protein [Aspergillus niger]
MKLSAVLCILAASMAAAAPLNISDNNHKIGRSEILYPREFGSPSSEPVAPGYSELGSPKVYVPENNLHAPKAPKEDYKSEEYKTDDIKSKGYQSVSSKPEVHQSVDFKPEVPKPEAPKPPAHPVNHVPTKQHESFSYDTHESYESQTTEQQ